MRGLSKQGGFALQPAAGRMSPDLTELHIHTVALPSSSLSLFSKTNDLAQILFALYLLPALEQFACGLSCRFLWSLLAGVSFFWSFSLVHLFSQSEPSQGPWLH